MSFAPDDPPLAGSPTWVRLDDPADPTLVVSYQIDRGRPDEISRTDTGTATIQINDRFGLLDPTNSSSPYFARIQPLVPVAIARWNPVTEDWHTRFRGVIEDWAYAFDQSQQVNRLTLTCAGLSSVLAAIQMQPGQFGDSPPAASAGQVFFDNANVDDRINQVYDNAGVDPDLYVTFSGNVGLYEAVYSPGESAMVPIQEAADAEFPGVSNVYEDRFGRNVFHGRLSRFDPSSVIAGLSDPTVWDYHEWKAGDGAAVAISPSDTAHIRQFAFNRGLANLINSVLATPKGIADADVAGQLVQDATSIGLYGIRSESWTELLTKTGLLDGSDALTETLRFATYFKDNYAAARNRPAIVGFRPMRPSDVRAAATWLLLCKCDISDSVTLNIGSPGGGGFTPAESFFIEGVHETVDGRLRDGVADGDEGYDNITLTLDLSPRAFFDTNPFPTS